MLNIPQVMFDRLRVESDKTGLKVNEIIRRAIDFYFTNK
jgi:hypothetical protein